VKKSPAISFKYFFYDFIRVTGWPLFIWFRPKRIYVNKKTKRDFKGRLILMSNHITMKDPLYLIVSIGPRRHHFLATKEMFEKSKFTRWLFTYAFLSIEVDRDNFGLDKLREIASHLEKEEMVTIFPEGHVNIEKTKLNAFKGGMAMLALMTGSPIIPIYIKKKEHWYSRLTTYIGEAIDVKSICPSKKFTTNDIKVISKLMEEKELELEMLCNKDKKSR